MGSKGSSSNKANGKERDTQSASMKVIKEIGASKATGMCATRQVI